MAISIPTRAQDSDPDTSQDQEGNTAEKDCAEKPESASAQEAAVHIDSQKRSNPNARPVSDHFGTTKLRRQKSPFGCEDRIQPAEANRLHETLPGKR